MENISFYLEKFKAIIGSEAGIRDTIIRVISEKTGAQIDSRDVTIKNNIVVVKGSPYLKSEIFMNKEDIMESLGKMLPKGKVVDIK